MSKPSLGSTKTFNRRKLLALLGFLAVGGIILVVASQASGPNYRTNWAFWGPRIRGCESGGGPNSPANYQAQNSSSTASGAYQFLDSTWANFGGYPKARLAPPEIQEQYAVQEFIADGTAPWAASYGCWATAEVPVQSLPTILSNKNSATPTDFEPLVPGAQDIATESKLETVDVPPAQGTDSTFIARMLDFLRFIGLFRV